MEVYFILEKVRNVIMGKTLFIAEKPSVAIGCLMKCRKKYSIM